MASHKVGAGFGAGVLIRPDEHKIGQKMKDLAVYAGGSQEYEIRAGSHNTAAIIAFARTLTQKSRPIAEVNKLTSSFENLLQSELADVLPVEVVAQSSPRLAGTSLVIFEGLQIDFFLMALDQEGIVVSTGTSCKSKSRTPSPALLAMSYNEEQALSVIRFSYAENFNAALQQQVLARLKPVISRLL